MRQRFLAFVLAAGAFVAGCAHGGIGNPEGWSVVKSKHFTIYAGTPRNTQLDLRSLELAYAAFKSGLFKHVDMNVDVVFLEDTDFPEVVGFRRKYMSLAKVPGGGPIGASGLLILKDDPGGNSEAEGLAHLFIDKAFPKAPLWFHEGFSSYARTVMVMTNSEGKRGGCFGKVEGGQDTLMPLEKLLGLSWDDTDGDEARSWYTYTARTLIDYIIHGEDGKNRERMGWLASAVSDGKSSQEAFAAAFPNVAPSAMDKKLGAHAADAAFQSKNNSAAVRGLCPWGVEIKDENAPDEGDPKIEPAPAAAIKAVLEAVKKLPRLDGYPPWYPADKIP
jgi:hypothetical protein